MLTKQEQVVANQLSTLLRQHGDALRTVAASAQTRRAAYISQIVRARPDLWTAAALTDFTNTQLESLTAAVAPGAFMANGAAVNCDDEEEMPMNWPPQWRL